MAEHEESDTNANLTAGNSEEGEAEVCMSLRAEASVAEEPGAENPHAGICAGGIEQSMSLLRCAPREAWRLLQGERPC